MANIITLFGCFLAGMSAGSHGLQSPWMYAGLAGVVLIIAGARLKR